IAGSGPLINNGTMTFTGGNSTISSPVENKAGNTLEVRGNVAVFQGAVVNRGNFKTTAANVVFQSLVSNAGTFYSDPSLQDFQAGFHNIDNNDGTPGFITTDPDEGIDRFRTGADFHISTANFELWNTTGARLEFYKGPGNTTGVHSLIYAGLDYGLASDSNGYLGFQKNLSWAEVLIETGNILATGTEDGRALYTEKLIFGSTNLADILAQVENFSGDLKIYYDPADNPYLQEQTFLFGEGEGYIAPVPEPSAMLLAGIGAIALSFRRRRQA
ncbi:MAG: PEP-CTERM sorting domain-containing protein, partial [Verrucomicrobiaceae bacterium]